jgi:hypothetical protein
MTRSLQSLENPREVALESARYLQLLGGFHKERGGDRSSKG